MISSPSLVLIGISTLFGSAPGDPMNYFICNFGIFISVPVLICEYSCCSNWDLEGVKLLLFFRLLFQ